MESNKAPQKKFRTEEIREKFIALYHQEPLLIRSPGRINLIGEHTDYNEGFVMPAAIDREMVFAIGLSIDRLATLYSLKHDETVSFDISDPARVATPLWANYMLGVARQFVDKGYVLRSFHCVMDGDVPTGAGLSSSAALECGFAFALNELFDFKVPKLQMVYMAQWAEHHYAGVMCGIMDQFASMMGEEGKAFVLDCRSLSYQYFSLNLREYTLVLCDSLVKHSLAASAYNTRRKECEEGVRILRSHYPEIHSLRDASMEQVDQHIGEFQGKIYDRCRFIVEENQRVLLASEDLSKGNLEHFGQRMYLSHDGLSRLYEVSCTELDFLVAEARKFPGVLGARMMGGGFGGCTINIVPKQTADAFISTLAKAYSAQFEHDMDHYVVALRAGTSVMSHTK